MFTKAQAAKLAQASWQVEVAYFVAGPDMRREITLLCMREEVQMRITMKADRDYNDVSSLLGAKMEILGPSGQRSESYLWWRPFLPLLRLFSPEAWLCTNLWGKFAPRLIAEAKETYCKEVAEERARYREVERNNREAIARDIDCLVG